jgi:hypothetical protein
LLLVFTSIRKDKTQSFSNYLSNTFINVRDQNLTS